MDGTFHEFEHAGWSDAATCAGYHRAFRAITLQSIPALLDAAGVGRGDQVLDVCCGAGYAAGLAAERGAAVVGVDFSPEQISLAGRQYPEIRFRQSDAVAMPFEAESFDCIVNSFGMCHFEDPDAAIAEAFRLLRPGGRFAFSVYADPSHARGFGLIYQAIGEHGTMDVGLPAGPNFFLFSDPHECDARLSKAGFAEIATTIVPQIWTVASADELLTAIMDGTVRASATLREQSDAVRATIGEAIDNGLEDYRQGSRYAVPMPAAITSAMRL
jgi:SAM-dependent methyltransferase